MSLQERRKSRFERLCGVILEREGKTTSRVFRPSLYQGTLKEDTKLTRLPHQHDMVKGINTWKEKRIPIGENKKLAM